MKSLAKQKEQKKRGRCHLCFNYWVFKTLESITERKRCKYKSCKMDDFIRLSIILVFKFIRKNRILEIT